MAPEAVSTHFDRVGDQAGVAQLLRAGCAHMRKAFHIEDINLATRRAFCSSLSAVQNVSIAGRTASSAVMKAPSPCL